MRAHDGQAADLLVRPSICEETAPRAAAEASQETADGWKRSRPESVGGGASPGSSELRVSDPAAIWDQDVFIFTRWGSGAVYFICCLSAFSPESRLAVKHKEGSGSTFSVRLEETEIRS